MPTGTPTATQTIAVIPVVCDGATRVYSGNTASTGSRRIFTYVCGAQTYANQWGPEHVYRFTTSATTHITAHLRPDYAPPSPGDPDLFLLSQLDGIACLPGGFGDMDIQYNNAPAGTYYVALDGWQGWAGAYTLELTCSSGATATPTAIPTTPISAIWIPIILVGD
jgi:hypothetical protein